MGCSVSEQRRITSSGTVDNAVRPLIAMTMTCCNPLQSWRAITGAKGAGRVSDHDDGDGGGILGLIVVVVMLLNTCGGAADFAGSRRG